MSNPATASNPRKNPASANGEAPKAPETAADKAETADSAEKRGRPGAIPTMPHGVVFEHEGKVHAGIYHPADKSSYVESGRGPGTAKGALEDAGFILGALTEQGPEWLSDFVPAGAKVHGYAAVKGFPLPKK